MVTHKHTLKLSHYTAFHLHIRVCKNIILVSDDLYNQGTKTMQEHKYNIAILHPLTHGKKKMYISSLGRVL